MKDKKLEINEKMRLVKDIIDFEIGLLNLEGEFRLTFERYSPEVHTFYIKEHKDSPKRVTHTDLKHIAERIKNEVNPMWNLGIIVCRPELSFWYKGDDDVFL